MKTIVVSAATAALIRLRAILPFKETATVLPNGDHQIPIDDEVWARLQELRFESESDSDLVVRLFATVDKKVN